MNAPKESYPLSWPENWPRTKYRDHSRFGGSRWKGQSLTIAKAVDFVENELRMLGASDLIVSTNLRVKLSGTPYSNQAQPQDPGVAVYFNLKKRATVLACDKWIKVEENLWAIGKHVEALRGQLRWGVGNIEQAFRGYAALPERGSGKPWWETLGITINASRDQIESAYRSKAKLLHPDVSNGETHEVMIELNRAYKEALTSVIE